MPKFWSNHAENHAAGPNRVGFSAGCKRRYCLCDRPVLNSSWTSPVRPEHLLVNAGMTPRKASRTGNKSSVNLNRYRSLNPKLRRRLKRCLTSPLLNAPSSNTQTVECHTDRGREQLSRHREKVDERFFPGRPYREHRYHHHWLIIFSRIAYLVEA